MTSAQIDKVLYVRCARSWNDHENRFARSAFLKEAQDCEYGGDALTQAWDWFLIGWRCKAADVVARMLG